MKKLLMVSLIVLFSTTIFAQDDAGGETPEGGLLIEITASPFGRDLNTYSESDNSTLLSFGQFRARYVVNETLVPRLGVWFSLDDNMDGLSSPDVTETVSQFIFTPGLEYHFLNEGGFTSYIALDAVVASRFMERISATGRDVTGAIVDPDDSSDPLSDPNVSIPLENRGFFGLGGYLAFGADYHFTSRFYVGAEIGFLVITAKTSDIEVNGNVFQEGFRFFDAGVNTTNSFRIGFRLF